MVAGAANSNISGSPHFLSESDYSAQQGIHKIGIVRVYTYDTGLYVWPEELLAMLGITVQIDGQTGAIRFHLADGSEIELDGSNNTYTRGGVTYETDAAELITRDNHVQISLDLLNRLLPKELFLANRADRTISVSDSDCGQSDRWCRVHLQTCDESKGCRSQPSSVPLLRSYVVDSAEEQPDEVAQNVQPPAEEAHKQAEESSVESLILQPQIKNLPAKGDFVEVIERAGTLYLPLNDMIQLLGFPVKIDKVSGFASGYIFTPDNQFHLNIAAHSIQVGKQQFAITPQDVLTKEGAIFISSEAFAKWFEVESHPDRKQLTIRFQTKHQLPEEESEERKLRWSKLVRNGDGGDDKLTKLDNPYQLIGYPVFDVSVNVLHNQQSERPRHMPTTSAAYNIQGAGDLAYATGHIYMAGETNGRGVDILRLAVGRKDPEASLLGQLHATEVAVGDITSPALTLVTTNSVGRGLMLTNRALDATENFDVRSFSGDSVPGYQAELYRNGELVGFQTVGSDGRYNFNNVQVLYGENVFRIVLYGPQGQKDERVETIEASASLLKKGSLEYSFGLDQRGASLIPVTPDRHGVFTPVGLQAVAHLRYGVTSSLTAGAFTAATSLADTEHYYYGFSLAGSLSSLQAETIYARDIETRGWAAGISSIASLYGVNLRAYYRQYGHFFSEAVNANDTPISGEMGVDTNAQALIPLLGAFSYGLSASRQTFENPILKPANSYGFRLARSLRGIGFSNALSYTDYPNGLLQDTFSLQSRFWHVDARLSGVYRFKPSPQFQDLNVTLNYLLTDHLSGQTEVDKGSAVSGDYSFTQTLYWDFDAFRLGFFGRIGDRNSYSAGVSLTFSLAHNPATDEWISRPKPFSDTGAVAGRVFLKPGEGEAGSAADLQDAKVLVGNTRVSVDSTQGYLASWVAPYRQTKIELDPNSIADPLLTPERQGYLIQTRPGSPMLVDFPLVMTTTVEGNAYIIDSAGHKQTLGETVVELEDLDGKPLRRGITEFDGYFSFDRVRAGQYRLGVPLEVLKELRATVKSQPLVNIQKVTEFISNRDIVLEAVH